MLFAGLGMLIVSCNNGDYNADPARNTDILNPLNPETGVTVPLGRVQAALNGSMRIFDGAAGWTDSVASTATFSGTKFDNAHTAEYLGATLLPYGSTGNYNLSDSLSNVVFYGVMDTNDHVTYSLYQGKASGVVNLKGNESNRLRGTFSATLHKVLPVEDWGDVIEITNGEFYVKKY